MPISTDSQKPVDTFDQNGKLLSTDTKGGKEAVAVDTHGRLFQSSTVSIDDLSGKAKPADAASTTTQEAPVANPEAEARKLFLEAQKAERRAKDMEKKAKDGLTKAQALEKAVEATRTGGDPTALLKIAGVDPIQFYKDMTAFALKPENAQEDPTQKKLREHQERLDQYARDLQVQADTVRQKEEVQQKNQIISTQVIPFLQTNLDKYEALITEYGANAAVEVFNAVWERYEKTGELVPWSQACDRMEEYWSQQIESGLNAASKLKKFANRFAQAQQTTRNQQPASKETPRSSFTLSNTHNTPIAPASSDKPPPGLTWEERAEWIKKKYA